MEIKSLIISLQKKQLEIDEAIRRDAIFEERLKLHREKKELKIRIKNYIERSNLVFSGKIR